MTPNDTSTTKQILLMYARQADLSEHYEQGLHYEAPEHDQPEVAHAETLFTTGEARSRRALVARGKFIEGGFEYHETGDFVTGGHLVNDGCFTVWTGQGWASFDAFSERGDFPEEWDATGSVRLYLSSRTYRLDEFVDEVNRRLPMWWGEQSGAATE